MFQPHKCPFQTTASNHFGTKEREADPQHRPIVDNDYEDQNREKHQIKTKIVFDPKP